MTFIVFHGNLSKNKELKDIIPGGYPGIDIYYINLSLIFLSLFVSWNYLLSLFIIEKATFKTYKEFC